MGVEGQDKAGRGVGVAVRNTCWCIDSHLAASKATKGSSSSQACRHAPVHIA